MKQYTVAVLGATGAVGQEMIKILQERKFPVGKLVPLASARSAGKTVKFRGKDVTIQEARDDAFAGVDIVLGAAENDIAEKFAPAIVAAGAVFVDNSSAFRLNPQVPLVVPEVNPEAIKDHKGIIANPNCSTIIMMMAVKPLRDLSKIKRIVVSTYQAVSGGGKEAMAELEQQVGDIVAGKEPVANILPGAKFPKHYQIAFNLIPQIDVFYDNLYTKEEMKMVNETRKILGEPDLPVTATTVRVPVYRSHAESVNIEFEDEVTVEAAKKAIDAFPGAIVKDDPSQQLYPMPLFTSGKNGVEVGRIRKDESIAHGLNLWVCGDQIRKGAALNALQIAEYMIEHDMF